LNIVTIASVEQEEIENLSEENENLADYIVVITESMTKTY